MTLKPILLIFFLTAAMYSCNSGKSSDSEIKPATTQAEEKGMFKVTILYPNGEGKTFDMKYYQEKHMPMMADILGSTLKHLHIDKGIANGADPKAPMPYLAIGYLHVESLDDYNKAVVPQLDKIRADFANYTNVQPVVQISEVLQ